jgi:hypothetical protein
VSLDIIVYQVNGEPMKFLTLADWTGMVETELFGQSDKELRAGHSSLSRAGNHRRG